mgnify:CR=1 FL=1
MPPLVARLLTGGGAGGGGVRPGHYGKEPFHVTIFLTIWDYALLVSGCILNITLVS